MVHITEGESLDTHTTFKVGGPAEYFVIVDTESALVEAVTFAEERELQVTVLGGGSNVLVCDEGISGLVIKNNIKGITYEETDSSVLLRAGAGEVFDAVVRDAVSKRYWGLENLSHIPGSVGATPIQNVGAYGAEVSTLIQSVRVFDAKTKTFVDMTPESCAFGYRDSVFKHSEGSSYIVTEVTYALTKNGVPNISYKDLKQYFDGKEATLQEIRDAVIAIRSKKFPDWHVIGTAGSFFKNPIISTEHYENLLETYSDMPSYAAGEQKVKVPLGWILDKVCGLRGVEKDAVGTYEGQALVIINRGGATAAMITSFAQMIEKKVFEKTKITIEWEVTKK